MAVGVGVRTVSLWDNFNLNAVFFSVICISICTYIELTRQCFFRFNCDLCERTLCAIGKKLWAAEAHWYDDTAFAIQTMCIENNNWLRIRDDYRFIHKMMRQRTNARPYFNAMNKFNSVYNSMNKMKENRISKWKDAIDSKWSVCHTRCHLATQFMTAQKFIYIQNRDQPGKDNLNCVFIEERAKKRADRRLVWTNANTVWMLVECACVCDLLLLVLNSRSKHKKQKQTDRETDNRSNTIERFDYVFNGGVDGYKLTDLWLFADWNSKVSICTYCHQTLNRGNRFVYIRSFSPSEAALGDCWLCHQAHWTLQYLCRWIKFEQLFSSTWWIHFHLILVVTFLLYFPYGYIE